MTREAQLVRSLLQVLTEAVWAERIEGEELKQRSGVEEPLFTLVCDGVERFAGQAVLSGSIGPRGPLLWVAKQAREELAALLGGLDPKHATALLCGLPGAARLGYASRRLASCIGEAEATVRGWEQQAYEQLVDRLSERTPLFFSVLKNARERADLWEEIATSPVAEFPAAFASNATREHPPASAPSEHADDLLERAAVDPDFDLRQFIKPALELKIRQAFHRIGLSSPETVKSLFSPGEQRAVELVHRRLQLEMAVGEEEKPDV
jgi:hypothetical protein